MIDEDEEDMQHVRIESMLNFTYYKLSDEIKAKVDLKLEALKAKIAVREARIEQLLKDHDIGDRELVQILSSFNQSAVSNTMVSSSLISYMKAKTTETGEVQEERVVGVGVISNYQAENAAIAAERGQVSKLELIKRNLVDLPAIVRARVPGELNPPLGHPLTQGELEYLGF